MQYGLMKILIVDDEIEILKKMVVLAEAEGYVVKTASSAEGLSQIIKNKLFYPNVIILDRILHNIDSVSLIPEIRSLFADTKILIVSAIDTPMEKASALDAGADDYLAKPFSALELIARVKALHRRKEATPEPTTVIGKLFISKEDRIVKIDGHDISLSQKEFLLLNLLSSSPGKVFPKENLLSKIWNTGDEVDTKVVEVTVNNLRRKLERHDSAVAIKNVRNVGYWLEA